MKIYLLPRIGARSNVLRTKYSKARGVPRFVLELLALSSFGMCITRPR